jgi:hypothetical protein
MSQPPQALGEKLIEGLASVIGIETEHQRQIKAHAKSMVKWHEDMRHAKEQDKIAWASLQHLAAMRPVLGR